MTELVYHSAPLSTSLKMLDPLFVASKNYRPPPSQAVENGAPSLVYYINKTREKSSFLYGDTFTSTSNVVYAIVLERTTMKFV